MRTKLKNRLTVILILLSFLVVSMVSVTIIFALSQQKISTEVGVEFYPANSEGPAGAEKLTAPANWRSLV